MSCIGYTSGGSPIFFGNSGNVSRKKTKGEKNTRYKCKSDICTARTTKNQLKLNGGVCFSCKTPIMEPTSDR